MNNWDDVYISDHGVDHLNIRACGPMNAFLTLLIMNINKSNGRPSLLRTCDVMFSSWRTLMAYFGERTYVSRYLCSPVPMFPEHMFPGAYVPRYRCSPVPMFPGFCTLIVVISINRLQILPTPWYDSWLGLCLGFRFRVLVRVRVRVSLEVQTVFRLRLGCGLGLSLYG